MNRKVTFFDCGGTWNMQREKGKFYASGPLNDILFRELEQKVGYALHDIRHVAQKDEQLAKIVGEHISKLVKKEVSLTEVFSWFSLPKEIEGSFISLFNGESSSIRASIVGVIVETILRYILKHPDTQVLIGTGTDTADVFLLPLLDVYLFDTQLHSILATGANKSRLEWNSDATPNLKSLFSLVHMPLAAGVYWTFEEQLYNAGDMVKIDPTETKKLAYFATYFSPHRSSQDVKKILDEQAFYAHMTGTIPPANHPIHHISATTIMQSSDEIITVNLGDGNSLDSTITNITKSKAKAIIVAGHSLGNGPYPIRLACINAAKQGKIVVIVSDSLIGDVNERYESSILAANSHELLATKHQLVSGHKVNTHVARALLIRILQEKYSLSKVQDFFNSYCTMRGLL